MMLYNSMRFVKLFTRDFSCRLLNIKMALQFDSPNSNSKCFFSVKNTNFKPVTHCIFDMDGLLLDTEHLYRSMFRQVCGQFGHQFDHEMSMRVQGMLRREVGEYLIQYYKLPLTIDQYLQTMKELQYDYFITARLMPDTEVTYKQIISEIVESYGKEYTKDIQLQVLGTTEQLTSERVVDLCQLPISVEEFITAFRDKQKDALGNAPLLPGAERLIRHLHSSGIPIAIATSSGEESVAIKTERHTALFDLFDHIVMGSSDPEVKKGKPAPDIFQVCAKRFAYNPSPEECLVFEDAPNGVTGAVAAGMQTVMVPDADLPESRTTHATIVLKSLTDFKPELFGLPAF